MKAVRSPSFLRFGDFSGGLLFRKASTPAMRRSERSEVLGAWGILPNKGFLHRVYTDALLAKDNLGSNLSSFYENILKTIVSKHSYLKFIMLCNMI